MIIATVPIPRDLVVPPELMIAARSPIIEVVGHAPLGADEWLGCCYANPHDDRHVTEEDFFVTLSIVSAHVVGDVHSPQPDHEVPRGTLFVIDPRCRHWLHHRRASDSTRTAPWVGLQWWIERRNAARRIRSLVRHLNGTWFDCGDRRYQRWIPADVDARRVR